VVGGGRNGAAIANIAQSAGARVALVDKNDWASGTSSKSTKLLHGGIRYLENFEFGLVAESLKERYIQWKNVPHLVKPMQFLIPVYKGQGRPLWMMKLGVWLYDVLSGRYSFGGHQNLSREDMIKLAPGIKQEGLIGGVSYFDAQMDDARLCLENVLMAKSKGADVSNYVEVMEFLKENGRAIGARVKDMTSGKTFDIRAKKIFVAAGPWSDVVRRKDNIKVKPRLRPTKGVHIVYRLNLGDNAFLLQGSDRRVFFAIPFHGNTLIGTTDTDYQGKADEVTVEDKDITYLLEQAKMNFPDVDFSRKDIISTFAGLRPLVYEAGSPSKISRQHAIERNFSGIYYVMGGKYTTYRAMALECVKKIMPEHVHKIKDSALYPLFGSGLSKVDVKAITMHYGVDTDTVAYLMSVYGSRFNDVLSLVIKDSSLKGRICTCSLAIRAQAAYAIQTEMAVAVDDIYERRLGLSYNECQTKECRRTISDMLKY
jgi:glycerol-3-phosphate dehydrogenase